MDAFWPFFFAAAVACAVTAYLRLLFTGGRPEPFWFAPIVLLIMGLILAFAGGVTVVAYFGGPIAQLLSALAIAWGGWVLLGLRRG